MSSTASYAKTPCKAVRIMLADDQPGKVLAALANPTRCRLPDTPASNPFGCENDNIPPKKLDPMKNGIHTSSLQTSWFTIL
ncbi:hypothetical protein EWI07_07685 [Sporolactobacillus sp. THM7-4]|nr:hypothetical protein EWI07_07685 [Sporolactobacillus sp. THM7-4]